eukprot:SAG11_NODE_4124_length_2053_cov_42.837769_1_plen_81_part_00
MVAEGDLHVVVRVDGEVGEVREVYWFLFTPEAGTLVGRRRRRKQEQEQFRLKSIGASSAVSPRSCSGFAGRSSEHTVVTV